jgi:DNA topoisomerase I
MSNLLIVESPAKCQKIRAFLGPDWTVCATMGHLRALEESLEAIGVGTGWTPKPNPKYHWLKEKGKAIQQLKSAAQQASAVYLAADDDREGEMIAYSVCVLLRLPTTTPRIVFHEITERAIRHALEHPRTIDMNRVQAQQARAMLDMMIGFTMSPLLWKYVAPTLSAGRCQTPALRLVIEREEQIESFVASRSWSMSATWSSSSSPSSSSPSSSSLFPLLSTTMADELEDEASVQQVLEHAHQTPRGRIIRLEIRPWTESAPEPLITSTLQQQASQLYHCSPKQTMCMAQRLYEAGHITYMRTDKPVMSEEAQEEARAWVRAQWGEAYVHHLGQEQGREQEQAQAQSKGLKNPRRPRQTEKPANAQEAHEAIRPTHLEVIALPATEWGPMERNLYQLISRRALQSVMAPAHGERRTITVLMEDLEDFPWISEEKRTQFDGWRRLGKVALVGDEGQESQEQEVDEGKDAAWTPWEIGTTVTWTEIRGTEKETKSQGRYTEASLVRELEKHGIGRPSTFASLLSVIQDKSYVAVQDLPPTPIHLGTYHLTPQQWPYRHETVQQTRGAEKRKLVPTALGRSVWEWISAHFNDLFAYPFTATMEKKLDRIAEGQAEEREVLVETWESYRERYETLMSSSASSSSASSASSSSASSASSVSSSSSSAVVASSSSSSSSSTVVASSFVTVTAKQRVYSNGIKAIQTKKGPLLLREGKTKADTQFFGWPKGISWEKMTEAKALQWIQESQGHHYMEWQEKPVVKKTGPYGPYLQWDGVSIPFVEGEAPEETGARLERKRNPSASSTSPASSTSSASTASAPASSLLKETTHYIIRNGPYGPYIMKKAKKASKDKPVFVSVPKGITVEALTDKEIDALYETGREAKGKGKAKGNPSKENLLAE